MTRRNRPITPLELLPALEVGALEDDVAKGRELSPAQRAQIRRVLQWLMGLQFDEVYGPRRGRPAKWQKLAAHAIELERRNPWASVYTVASALLPSTATRKNIEAFERAIQKARKSKGRWSIDESIIAAAQEKLKPRKKGSALALR